MKKYWYLAFIALLLFSCATTPKKTIADYSIEVQSSIPTTGITISVTDFGRTYPLIEQPSGIRGILLNINNNSSGIMQIDWGKSSINYEGSSYGIFLEGMKYMDAGKTPPMAIIPKGGNFAKFVYSANQPYYEKNWYMHGMKMPIQIMLCTQIEGKEVYFTISISEK